ncbi:MAG: arginine--tRNA ligase [Alphaproteobacteria bacterium]|nr:arginine--tRNA ligase [Alphaproteobacteria bacterium]
MTSLILNISKIVAQAFADEGLEAGFGQVKTSDRPDLAQFQCNGAMAAAKVAKLSPRAVAEKIVARLNTHDIFSKIEIAGPGFINLNLTDDALGEYVNNLACDPRLGVRDIGAGATVVLDYGGPNVAKAMHVGHLRASIIGDTLRRVLKFAGYDTIGDVHMGDWGTMMGMVISELELRHPEWIYFQEDFSGPYPDESPVTIEDLAEIYPTASGNSKSDPARMALSHRATVELQNKRPGYYALWQKMVEVSIASMKSNFAALNVYFDLWLGEASVHDVIAPMVEDLKAKHYAVMDDGALVVPLKRNEDTKEYPPLFLYKRDGAVMYSTTDLATIVDRVEKFHPAKILYIVDQRQNLHFEQVFRAAYLTGIVSPDVELTHVGHGTMNGPDGKPFKTRAGGVLRLEDLIALGLEKARQRLHEAGIDQHFSGDELDDIARKVSVAAIKFADLQNNRMTDYIFDLDRLTSFEGKTGPYLLYQVVRIKSLHEKADYQFDPSHRIIVDRSNRDLVLMMVEWPQVLEAATRDYAPHFLCDYVYKLAQMFSSYYAATHVLSQEDVATKISALALSHLVLKHIEMILDLLGIYAPQRM